MQNVRCTSLFKILSTKKPIFKKSEKLWPREEKSFWLLNPVSLPIRKSKTKY